jgi:CubicO group peptidase (beta-lactamase class C family)
MLLPWGRYIAIVTVLMICKLDLAQVLVDSPTRKPQQPSGREAPVRSGDADLSASAAAYMQEVQQSSDFSGVVLIARRGHILFVRPYGMANLEHDVPNTIDTKFRLASITKQFTAAAILILQERGKLSVSDSICKYLPDCPKPWKPITLHQLLSHSSGIPSFTEFSDNDRYDPLPTPVLDTVARFKDKPLDFPPGQGFHYSDSGYLLLGYVVEQASGEKYEDFLKETVYQPLGMLDSGYDHPEPILKHRSQGYAIKNGSAVNAAFMAMDTPFGGGSQYSTVKDLLLWDQALYGEKILSQSSIKAMFTPNPEPVPPEWLLGKKGGYGYGWMIEELFGRKLYVHGGLINGFSSIIMRYPEDRTLIVVLSNREEDFPGDLKDLKIVAVGEGLSAVAFGRSPLARRTHSQVDR